MIVVVGMIVVVVVFPIPKRLESNTTIITIVYIIKNIKTIKPILNGLI